MPGYTHPKDADHIAAYGIRSRMEGAAYHTLTDTSVDFYYRSWPPQVVSGLIVLFIISTEIYNIVTVNKQCFDACSNDIKYMTMHIFYGFPLFADALYDLLTNADKSLRSELVASIFAGVQGILLLMCIGLTLYGEYYMTGRLLRIGTGGKYARVPTTDNDIYDEIDDDDNDHVYQNELNSIFTSLRYVKYNAYFKLNYIYGSMFFAFISCLTFIIKAISIATFEDLLNDNLMQIYIIILLVLIVVMSVTDIFIFSKPIGKELSRFVFTPYAVMLAFSGSVMIDYHDKRKTVDILIMVLVMLSLAAVVIKTSQVAIEIDRTRSKPKTA